MHLQAEGKAHLVSMHARMYQNVSWSSLTSSYTKFMQSAFQDMLSLSHGNMLQDKLLDSPKYALSIMAPSIVPSSVFSLF